LERENLASAMLAAQENQGFAISYLTGLVEPWPRRVIADDDGVFRSVGILGVVAGHNIITAVIGPYTQTEDRLSLFLSNHRMAMLVYAYEPDNTLSPAGVSELPADVWSLPPHATDPVNADRNLIPYEAARLRRGEGAGADPTRTALVVSMPRSSLRELGRNLRGLQQPIRYRFVVGTRSLSGGVVEIARSELVDFSTPEPVRGAFGGMYVLSTTNDTGFDVRHIQDPVTDTSALESVVWSIPEEDFVDFAMLCIARAQHTREQNAVPGVRDQAILEVD
jgi:hypothetical protein